MNVTDRRQNQDRPMTDAGSELNERLSAWLDGEAGADACRRLSGELDRDPLTLTRTLASYQLIGETLRSEPALRGGVAATAFLDEFRGRLAQQPDEAAPRNVSVHGDQPAITTGVAANDAVFRWKLVAGLASVAAVMAVAWGALNAVSPATGSGAQLAGGASVTAPVAAGTANVLPVTAVVVETPQGNFIRDPRLQQFLAEHRQNGMSALQMPAGFLRSATHDGTPSR
jgi:sigma-E factor negative regulatory protein RseA